MHTLTDHVWAFRFADGLAHQWSVPLAPDEEGIVTGLCDVEAMPSGLAEEGTVGLCPTCGMLLRRADDRIDCLRCDRVWGVEDWPRLAINFDGLRCFTCLLRAGHDFSAGLAARRLPDPAEFRHAVRTMRTEGPDNE